MSLPFPNLSAPTRKLVCLFALALGLAAAAPDATAQFKFGPRLTIDVGDEPLEELAIGADARINPGSVPVQLNGNFDFYLIDGGDVFGIDLNAVYLFGIDNAVFTPYAGAGLGILNISPEIRDSIRPRRSASTSWAVPNFPSRRA